MTEVRAMIALANDYLTERRQLGFDLTIQGSQIKAFARFADESGHTGPLTTEIVLGWVKGKARHAVPFSWARRLETLRPFAGYLARGIRSPSFRRQPSLAGHTGGSRHIFIPVTR